MTVSRAKLLCKAFARRDARRRASLIRDIRVAMADGKEAAKDRKELIQALESL